MIDVYGYVDDGSYYYPGGMGLQDLNPEDEHVERVRLLIRGRVQGVYYRASTRERGARAGPRRLGPQPAGREGGGARRGAASHARAARRLV